MRASIAVFISLLIPAFAHAQVTPNMNLDKPVPGITSGPTWAEMINDAFDLVDSHDHSSGKGVKINPSGMNINADLEFNGNDATELRTTRFESQAAPLSGGSEVGQLYRVGGDLYWNNGSGAQVQVTSGTGVVANISNAFSTATPGAYPYTVTGGDVQKVLLVDTNSNRTLNLPAATTVVLFMVKDATGLAGTNSITVARNGSDTIDGAGANKVLNQNYGTWLFVSDGVNNWTTAYLPSGTIGITGGGTGAVDVTNARINLGVAIGSNVQAWDADLDTISGLAKTDGNVIVGDGSNWVVENGNTARTSLGLGTTNSPAFTGLTVSGQTASQPLQLDGNNAVISVAAATFRANHSLAKSGVNTDITAVNGITPQNPNFQFAFNDSGTYSGLNIYDQLYQRVGFYYMFQVALSVTGIGVAVEELWLTPSPVLTSQDYPLQLVFPCALYINGVYADGVWTFRSNRVIVTKADGSSFPIGQPISFSIEGKFRAQ